MSSNNTAHCFTTLHDNCDVCCSEHLEYINQKEAKVFQHGCHITQPAVGLHSRRFCFLSLNTDWESVLTVWMWSCNCVDGINMFGLSAFQTLGQSYRHEGDAERRTCLQYKQNQNQASHKPPVHVTVSSLDAVVIKYVPLFSLLVSN